MFKKIRFLIPTLLMFSSLAMDTHLRTGVDFNVIKMDVDVLANISISYPYPLPNLTAEIRTPLDKTFDVGISGTYIPVILAGDSYHALKVAMHSYKKYSQGKTVGLGLHIHHVPLHTMDASILGYLNNLSVGVSLQGDLSNNFYSYFEIRHDITPRDSQFWESYLANENQIYALAPSLISFRYFSSSISIGYILPTDSDI